MLFTLSVTGVSQSVIEWSPRGVSTTQSTSGPTDVTTTVMNSTEPTDVSRAGMNSTGLTNITLPHTYRGTPSHSIKPLQTNNGVFQFFILLLYGKKKLKIFHSLKLDNKV